MNQSKLEALREQKKILEEQLKNCNNSLVRIQIAAEYDFVLGEISKIMRDE
jgi:hypothetical protein